MITSRTELEKALSHELERIVADKKDVQRCIESAKKNYNMPRNTALQFFTLRKPVAEANIYELFVIAETVLESDVPKFFSEAEISMYKNMVWEVKKAEFPLRYKMTKINDDQYIGKISVHELMLLKDAQLINYNENAQRTMKHVVKGDVEYYQISLNKKAVDAIVNSYESDLYIPNTITLNLPEEAIFKYDEKEGELIIKETPYLDILDGYHRYIAMSKIYSLNQEFDYDMELRIVQFEESKAKRFIWQEDQKTKMRKIDSDAMDSAKVSNKIVERMNNDSVFSFAGEISRNKGIINASQLANVIEIVMLKGTKKSEERAAIKKISDKLMKSIEELASSNEIYYSTPWSKLQIYMIVYEAKYGDIDNFDDDLAAVEADGTIYTGTNLHQSDVTRTHKLLGKEGY